MLILYALTLVAGIATAIEPGQNAALAKSLARPALAGFVCIVVSIVTIAIVMLATSRYGWPGAERIARVPWWAWFGGLFSALLAAAQLIVSQRIGAAPFLGIIVTAGVVTSILLDHFGLVGFEVHAAGLGRIVGGALMIGGVTLIARY